MRQAGRYLPEYKEVRKNFRDFLNFCYTPEAACEVTLQPISRFGMSAAIIFSDILVIPDALGMNVTFQENIGPVLSPLASHKEVITLSKMDIKEKLFPVYDALKMTRKALPADKALIGFCGAPWTLACYMLQGKSSRDFSGARSFPLHQPDAFSLLTQTLIHAVAQHAIYQIDAGANVIQIFDSWSGVLSEVEFERYVMVPTTAIVQEIKQRYPNVPIIGFPRLCGQKLAHYAEKTGVDAVSFDCSVTLDFAKNSVQKHCLLQGNLDSQILAEDKNLALQETKRLLEKFAGTPFIFNLAHGILPHTPIDHVQAVSDMIKAQL